MDDADIFGFDIRATHDRGRKIRGAVIFDNQERLARAFTRLSEIRVRWPRYRFAIVARYRNGSEKIIDD